MKNLLSLLLITFLISCTTNKSSSEEIDARIERIENNLQKQLQIEGENERFNIEDRLRELGIPGVSIAVVINGELDWAKGYGMADSSENRTVDSNTLFLAGSISKPVAAVRALQLYEQGILDIDENVNTYLTSWKLPENEFTVKEKVTTRRMLNHTAGLTVWGFPGYDKGDTIPTVPEVLDGKGNTDSVRVYKEPGESWQYSGGGYTIMQLMITDLEKQSFPELMETHVLSPLGMEVSTFKNPLPGNLHHLAATGYRRNGSEVEGKWPIYPEMAAAGLWTTPTELIKYPVEIQQILLSGEDGLLKKETVDQMLTPGMNNHGLGPTVSELTFGHNGADEGFRAGLVAWKESADAVVIMVNSDNGSIMFEILLAIAEEYNLKGIEPNRKRVAEMSETKLSSFEGTYAMNEFGETKIRIMDRGLACEGGWFSTPAQLLPENDSVFFNASSGTQYTFQFDDEVVSAFRVWDNYAKKVD